MIREIQSYNYKDSYRGGNIKRLGICTCANIEVADGVGIPAKIAEFNNTFSSVKVTDMEDYVSQTLGGLIEQLSLAAVLAFILAVAIAILITAMFFKMLIVKEAQGIAVMRSLGLSCRDIRLLLGLPCFLEARQSKR